MVEPYLGERARIAVQLLNASWAGPPIVADGEGFWLAPRHPTAWDRLIKAPTHLRWSDETVIAVAADMGGLLVTGGDVIGDQRAVQPGFAASSPTEGGEG